MGATCVWVQSEESTVHAFFLAPQHPIPAPSLPVLSSSLPSQVTRVEAEVQAAHVTAKRSREALALAQREVCAGLGAAPSDGCNG